MRTIVLHRLVILENLHHNTHIVTKALLQLTGDTLLCISLGNLTCPL
jgi:hypothetical protein